jgi:APA family basic amino acid/polyamine antiporter
MRNPEKDLPRAIFLALAISTVLYILVALSAVSVLGWSDLSRSGAPLAAVAGEALGEQAKLTMTLIALASTANTVLLMLFAASRAMYAMSCAGVLPMAFCVIGEKRRTPWITIIIVGVFASLFALIENIGDVADFTNFATLLAFAAVNAAALKLFGGIQGRGFKHRFVNIGLPCLGFAVSLLLAANAGWRAALFGAGLLTAGLVFLLVMLYIARRRQNR